VFGGNSYTCGASGCRLVARWRWSEAREGRQEASRKSVSQPVEGAAELRIAELERLLGRKQVELDFFKRTFEQVRGAAANRSSDGDKGSIAASKPRPQSKG
jgi:hypothetical protein